MPKRPSIPSLISIPSVPAIGGESGLAFDPDAQDFFTRASITDSTQKDAVNDMVVSLKSASLWTRFDVIYPFVGGSATPHTFNLRSSSFQITWNGTLTHNSSGVKGNGTTGYGNTGYIPSAGSMGQDNASFSCYINSADTTGGAQMGTPSSGATVNVFQLFTNLSGNSYYYAAFGTDTGKIQGANGGNTTGMFTGSRDSSSAIELYREGSSVLSGSGASEGTPPTLAAFLFARNNAGVAATFSDCRLAFAAFGISLDSGQAESLATINAVFQTALGRL